MLQIFQIRTQIEKKNKVFKKLTDLEKGEQSKTKKEKCWLFK